MKWERLTSETLKKYGHECEADFKEHMAFVKANGFSYIGFPGTNFNYRRLIETGRVIESNANFNHPPCADHVEAYKRDDGSVCIVYHPYDWYGTSDHELQVWASEVGLTARYISTNTNGANSWYYGGKAHMIWIWGSDSVFLPIRLW